MIEFTKMQGLGNDYVYINTINYKIENPNKLAIKISDRHFGIGSDGLILIGKSSKNNADFSMRIFNNDGSEAEMCGNGIRCVAKYIYEKGLSKKDSLNIDTLAGIKKVKLNIVDNLVKSVCVDMGEPILDPHLIPVTTEINPVTGLKIKVDDAFVDFTCVSMGNPHAITFIDDVNDFNVEKYGKLIENNEIFPNKTNVEFVQVLDKENVRMRVWERGSGETLACGTGASACMVACVLNNLTERKVNVELLGGILNIEWGKDNHVYMTGPAEIVFEGFIKTT